MPLNTSRSLLVAIGAALLLGGGGLLGGYFFTVGDAAATGAEAETVGERPSGEVQLAAVREKTQAFLAKPLVVMAGDREVQVEWAELGASVDEESVALARLNDAGELSGLVPVTVDSAAVEKTLRVLKSELDRPAKQPHLDLEGRKVIPAQPGAVLDMIGSAERIQTAARLGREKVELAVAELAAPATDLGIDDISTVISSFSTKYRVSDSRRNDNLKLLASRIDGTILKPGEVFSFNETSGGRSEAEGYKMATVIMKGEMVDGMAGGACQISTTLNGAAFKAGIELVESTPHSRPSAYAPRGMDATVVWPTTDLKLRNNYEFPIAVHFKVARGVASVEILGKEKPFDEIKWETSTQKRIPFETITREDGEIGVGYMVVDQKGEYGFKVKRYRRVIKDGKVVKKDEWDLAYRPVVEYVRMGTNTDPNLPPPKQRTLH